MTRLFEWDARKAASNEARHGLSFVTATRVFLDPRVEMTETTRPEDGERRFKAIGLVDGRLFTVVFTLRGEATRLISARRANATEMRYYGNREIRS